MEIKNPQFEDVRPYYEEEIPQAMQRIASSEAFPLLASFVYPELSIEEARAKISSFKTVYEFQTDTMRKVNEQIIKRSITDFSCSGLDKLDSKKSYLFISNHRDIVLDSCLLQYSFVEHNLPTTQITFGANLMINPLVIDIGKANRMFKVERPGGNMKEFYAGSLHLSEYIRFVITKREESVWIAQRNGRTKNGIDATDQGIIKMLCMSEQTDKIKAVAELNIVPVSVSYEWEPCDVLKAIELYESQSKKYTKKPGEDLNSILTGILQQKGKVHFEVCTPITVAELMALENTTRNEYHKAVAKLLDRRINPSYRLYPNNYIAHDMLFGNTRYQGMYTPEEKKAFIEHMKELERYDCSDVDTLKEIFMGIYANPVDNR